MQTMTDMIAHNSEYCATLYGNDDDQLDYDEHLPVVKSYDENYHSMDGVFYRSIEHSKSSNSLSHFRTKQFNV